MLCLLGKFTGDGKHRFPQGINPLFDPSSAGPDFFAASLGEDPPGLWALHKELSAVSARSRLNIVGMRAMADQAGRKARWSRRVLGAA